MSKPKRFEWLRALRKGILPALGTYVVTTLQTGDISLAQILTAPQEQIPAVLGSLAVGAIPFVVNVYKQRKVPGNPFYVAPSFLPLVLCALALGGMVSGCITTTHPDGTVVQQVDVSTAWAIYEAIQAERERLDAQREAADAADRARIDAQLRALGAAADRAFQRWLDAGGRVPTVTVE